MANFEVGSIFKIIDEASPVLRKLMRQVTDFDKLITDTRGNLAKLARTQFSGLETRITGITDSATKLGMAFGSTFDAIHTGSRVAAYDARALAAEWRSVSSAMAAAGAMGRGGVPAMGGGNPRSRVGGSHGGPFYGSIGSHGPKFGARIHGSTAAMAGAGALAYGVYQEAEIEDIAARAIMTGQVKIDGDMTSMAAFKTFRDVIQRNAAKGGFSPKEVGEAILGSERQFAGLGFDKRMNVLDVLLPAAMQEARFKETNLKESAEALVGLAHMTGTYDPAKLPELYRQFNFASMITPASLPEFTRALSYSMPSLVAGMGMDPTAVMFLTAMNQAAGIKSTKAGTWVQAFFGKLMPDVGINLNRSGVKHNEALSGLGLLGSNGQPNWMVQNGGKTDWMASLLKLAPILGEHLQALPETQRLQMLDQVFGKQGGREAGLMNLKEFVDQFPRLAQLMKTAPGGESFLGELGKDSPVQKARDAFADLTNVLMDLGKIVLPPLTSGLQAIDLTLKSISSYLPASASPAAGTSGNALRNGIVGGAIAGGLAGSVIPGLGTFWGGVGGAFVGGTAGLYNYMTTPGPQSWNSGSAGGDKTIQVATTINVDGNAIAKAVTAHQVRAASGPLNSASSPDYTMPIAMPF